MHLLNRNRLTNIGLKKMKNYSYQREKDKLGVWDQQINATVYICLRGISGSKVKNPPVVQEAQEMPVQSLDLEDPLQKEMATHSSILAWKIPWTEEPGGL